MAKRRQNDPEANIPADGPTEGGEPAATTAGAEAGAAAAPPQQEQARRPYKAVRSWTERYVEPLRYQKLTDDRMRKIIFRFKLPEGQDKPSDAALEVMRAHKQTPEGQPTGLKFEGSRTHGKVWTIPNDPEGRELADRIDLELSRLAQKMEAAQPTPA